MMNRLFLMVLLSLLMTLSAFAEVQYVAVLEFRGVELDEQILHNLSDQTRRGATDLLSKDEYLIMTRENMMGILQDMGKDATCVGGMCEIEIGRNLGADIVVTGDIVQYGETYVLTLKLYTTGSGALIETVEVQEKDLLELKNDAFSQSKVLFQKGLGLSNGSANIQNGFTGDKPGADDWMVTDSNTAVVQFESSPKGAVVLVDGQLLCTETPCSKELTSGGHTVVFQKERYFPHEVMINAKSGMTFSGDLKPRFGHVSVSSSPSGVKILMDGEAFGTTPISGIEVDAGIHTLSIEDPCYVGQEYRFQMKTGGVEDVTYPVTARQSAIKVTVSDKENVLLGDVYVDGTKVGQSSSVIKVPLCSQEVQVKVNDRIFTETLSLQERQVSDITVDANQTQESRNTEVIKSVDYTAKLIAAGTFTMGCTSEQVGCEGDETPTHKVTLTQDFYMMQSEVTQELYQRVMNRNPSKVKSKDHPVERVNWYDAIKFANKLSSMEGLEQCYFIDFDKVLWLNMSCTGWRLPTEAEWEFAARGGESYMYSGGKNARGVSWYTENSEDRTHDVCGKRQNSYGLCDMSGNVSEWVWDQHEESYDSSSTVDPTGPTSGYRRVIRGGDFDSDSGEVRASKRFHADPMSTSSAMGFRLVRIVNESYAPLR